MNAAGKAAGLTLTVEIAPYNRAKSELESGATGLIGHTPYRQEDKAFYGYAQELNWSVMTNLDLYAADPAKLAKDRWKTLKIGTPLGNKEFMAQVLGVPESVFYEQDLTTLLKLLPIGRIDAVAFERAGTMSTIRKLGLAKIYYQNVAEIPAGLAVSASGAGSALRSRLEKALSGVDVKGILGPYSAFLGLPPSGQVH